MDDLQTTSSFSLIIETMALVHPRASCSEQTNTDINTLKKLSDLDRIISEITVVGTVEQSRGQCNYLLPCCVFWNT